MHGTIATSFDVEQHPLAALGDVVAPWRALTARGRAQPVLRAGLRARRRARIRPRGPRAAGVVEAAGQAPARPVSGALEFTKDVLADDSIARVDSCAAADHPLINHLWCDRHAVADRMLAVRPERNKVFDTTCALERVRRRAIDGAKAVRDWLRR